MDISGDYLSAKQAFDEAPRRFGAPGGTNHTYEQYIQGLTEHQRQAHVAGVGSDLNRRLYSHNGGPSVTDFISSPNARARLVSALGPERGAQLHQRIQNALDIRKGSADLLAGARRGNVPEQQREILRSLGITDLDKIPTNKRDLLRQTANVVVNGLKGAVRRSQMGWNREALQQYAEVLMQ